MSGRAWRLAQWPFFFAIVRRSSRSGLKAVSETILVVNAGSSSIKFQLFSLDARDQLHRLLKGQIEGIGVHPRLIAKGDGQPIDKAWSAQEVASVSQALDKLVAFLRTRLGKLPMAIGHRVVHGGPDYSEPVLIDDAVLDRLETFSPLAPLHQPNNLAPIRAVRARQPQLLQVACFDTAFHRGHPEVADRYALPEALYAEGVRRYGFHGLSYEYIASRLPEFAPNIARGRVIVAHLGSGASMCAISAGKSVESTLGFTALDGLPMGTRPGQLDPGVVLYLMEEKRMSAKEIERFLYNECGLKGLSGISNDVRELLASDDPRAKLALNYFAYRISLYAGMLAAAMGGIDGFVFTAGIGENTPAIREAVAARVAWLGLDYDREANASGNTLISRPSSRVACYVIPTDEELMIARHTLAVLRAKRDAA
jgi:acetate kinase